MVLDVDRRQALAYRIAVQGLHRDSAAAAELAVLDLGVQETNVGSARVALAARLAGDGGGPMADPAFVLLWSFRGAPHLHRAGDVAGLVSALWPAGDADAMARLAAERAPLKAAGVGGLAAFATAAEAMRAVVTGPMTKGKVSAGVTARLPDEYSYRCRGCRATHVYAGLFQLVGLFAGVRLVPDSSPTILAALDDRPPIPPAASGVGGILGAYLRLQGPATLADAAGYLGTNQAAVRPAWPDDLAEVRVDGRRTWIPGAQVDALRDPPAADNVVRLLPPSDPYLQGRDRDLLVPDKARQKAVWRILANPGAVLAGGDIAGVWRARLAGKARLEVTVKPFEAMPASTRRGVGAEAGRVAAVRGVDDVRVRYEDL